jgi:hypothetical protein
MKIATLPSLARTAFRLAPAAMAAVAMLSAPALAAPQAKPDQVFRVNPRTNKASTVTGTVTEDGLENVKVTRRDGREISIKSAEVIQIAWGSGSTEFTDGGTYAGRGAWEEAVKSYQEAAGDTAVREPLRAEARLRAATSLMALAASDMTRFGDVAGECDRFMTDFPSARQVPEVLALKARAQWLNGDAAAARDGYRSIYDAGKGGAEGYSPIATADAAMHAAYAAISAGDNVGARELFDLAAAAYGAIESENASVMASAAAGAEVAGMGEAITKASSGDAKSVRRTFESASKSSETSAGMAAAHLGLGHAWLAEGDFRKAQFEFAWVAGLDHTSADRRAEALVGLAEAGLKAGEAGDANAAKTALRQVASQYGATPSARKAAQLLESL